MGQIILNLLYTFEKSQKCEVSEETIFYLNVPNQDNLTFFSRVNDKLGLLRERDASITNLEAEISEILSKLNLLQGEKGKLIENETVSGY